MTRPATGPRPPGQTRSSSRPIIGPLTGALLLVAVALTTAPGPALAQSTQGAATLARMEAVSTTMNAMMNEALVAEIPALDGLMPDPAWDDGLRTAYTCMHDGYVARVGEAAVSDMVTQMEASLATLTPEQLIQGDVAVENPDGLSDTDALVIVQGCGLMEAFMNRLAASGAMDILMQQQ